MVMAGSERWWLDESANRCEEVRKKNEEEALADLKEAAKYAPGDAAIVKEQDLIKKKVQARKEKELKRKAQKKEKEQEGGQKKG